MKPKNAVQSRSTGKPGAAAGPGTRPRLPQRSSRLPKGLSRMDLPMEWMDPMSWRLPSGKALAEFALQAGFLAPSMLEGPRAKRDVRDRPAGGSARKIGAGAGVGLFLSPSRRLSEPSAGSGVSSGGASAGAPVREVQNSR